MSADRPFSWRALFAVVYTTSVSGVYFSLGVVTRHAGGLTPFVFLLGGLFFQLSAMTYAEGASLHRERGGSAVLGRYAFNELVSFVAGWSIVLDYTILLSVCALTVPAYLAAFYGPLGHGAPQILVAFAVIGFVAIDNVRGVSSGRLRRRIGITGLDLALQALVIVLGLALALHPGRLTETVHLGTAPTWSGLGFALPIAVIAFTGLEAAASIAGEVREGRGQIRSLVLSGSAVIVLVYVGIAFVGISALPVHHGLSDLGRHHLQAPLLGVALAFHPHWLARALEFAVAIGGALGLAAGAGSSMLGVSRVGYSLATNRQIPSSIGRLEGRFGTPYVVIGAASLAAAALVLPADLELLIGLYAFGALVAFLIAHLSVIALRFREPDRARPYRVPFSLRVRGVPVPVPAVLGALLSLLGLIAVLVYHSRARWVGLGWLLAGLVLYVAYRKTQGKPLLRRVTIPEQALRHERATEDEAEYGSIVVPIFGTALDDDIVQTAARLAGESHDDAEGAGAVIEAIWILEMPLSLPLDAPVPESQVHRAREALKRAKAVGEEYEGVQVATAVVRARRAAQKIVSEARRRGAEAIVLAAEEPSRVRGGGLLGGSSPENTIGDVTRYVIGKAPCRVILTAPPEGWQDRFAAEHDVPGRAADGALPAAVTEHVRRQRGERLMARIETQGLRRSVGLGGLFSTAYGNVGSSIYYALGLVAAYALGLTPVIFMLAGGLFAITAKTYAEGASMFPEAGGSSSFARHAFNEFVSFFAGWALSPRLHPHDRHLRLLRAALPGRVLAGADPRAGGCDRRTDRRRVAGAAEHPRDRRVGQAELLPGARRPLDPDPDHHRRRVPDPQAVPARPSGPPRDAPRPGRARSSPCRWRCSPTPGSRRCRTWPRRRATRAATSRARST